MAAIIMKAGIDGASLSPLEAQRFGMYRFVALHSRKDDDSLATEYLTIA